MAFIEFQLLLSKETFMMCFFYGFQRILIVTEQGNFYDVFLLWLS